MTDTVKDAITYDGPDRIVHYTDFLAQKSGRSGASHSFKSGFESFDAVCGLETGEVVVVTGFTKNGKTLFAESWIHNIVRADPSAVAAIFSFEVQTEKLLQKYIPSGDIPVFVPLELKTMDFDWLVKRCAEAKYKHHAKIVLIDHLHFLIDMNTQQNMSLNIGAFMRRLKKDIALGLDLAVILIAHQGQPKEGKEASLSNIRDSSFVGQESDATIVVSRRANLNEAELKEVESRSGAFKAELLRVAQQGGGDDKFSGGLAVVKIECHRRTGVFGWRKMFRKNGHWVEEL